MKRDRYLPAAGCLVLLVALVSWLQPLIPVDDPVWRRGHDVQLKKHAKHYFGVYTDWRWFRAQGIVESGLRPEPCVQLILLGRPPLWRSIDW